MNGIESWNAECAGTPGAGFPQLCPDCYEADEYTHLTPVPEVKA